MKIGIYTKSKSQKIISAFEDLLTILIQKGIYIWLNEVAYELYQNMDIKTNHLIYDNKPNNKTPDDLSCLITIGGDGTFISGITQPEPQKIPTLGINTGKLGFLADILPEEVPEIIDLIINNNFDIEKRTLLTAKVLSDDIKLPHALNEIAILKHHAPNMIRIHTYINDLYLTSYWADGLIIATPTGSTAYSMSAGGPIIHPESKSLVLTPIAPHNLTIRPLVIPENNKITLNIDSLDKKYLVSVDANSYTVSNQKEIVIEKSNEYAPVIKMKQNHFYNTLRNKLMWGVDKRN